VIEHRSEENIPPTLPRSTRDFRLGIDGFAFRDLFEPDRLRDLDASFRRRLAESDGALAARYEAYRLSGGGGLGAREISSLLVQVAPHVSRFLAALFHVDAGRERLARRADENAPLWRFRREIVQRRALKRFSAEQAAALDLAGLEREMASLAENVLGDVIIEDDELRLTSVGSRLLVLEQAFRDRAVTDEIRRGVSVIRRRARALPDTPSDEADLAFVQRLLATCETWAAACYHQSAGRARVSGWASFRLPHDVDYEGLVELRRPRPDLPEIAEGPAEHFRRRDGFSLTDPRMGSREIQAEVEYCLYCHERDKDSCSKGLKKGGALQQNPLGIPLAGCPLDEKISEAHLLRKQGDDIAALALICIDNPMCPGTGHRICNDCMKACIFQKQEPVNIPQIETGVLTDVLALRHGFEIYSLLTRWNPLNVRRPYALPYNGKNVLVVGMGPAGYTLAHHLLNEGFGVVGVDGLKIEPLESDITGADSWPPRAIENYREIYQDLEDRTLLGFGGVSEYGITVRWDKNFLTPIYLTLLRNRHLRIYGGVRFGGTFSIDDAWAFGFDHIAIAAGAGKPTLVDMKNNLIPGIRQASDFLMALQLTGAYKDRALANLQVELPAVVIGGGLTAIDTATELAAYYPVQVEKILARFEELAARYGEESLWQMYNPEERASLTRFLAHGREVREARAKARATGEAPDLAALVRSWGGVTIAYRRRLNDSPAYRLNHEEVVKSLEEGIYFAELLSPVEAVPDEHGRVKALRLERQAIREGKLRGTGELVTLPARTVCVAAGTSPNIIYNREHPGTFEIDIKKNAFQAHRVERGADGEWKLVHAAPGEAGFFTSYHRAGRFITFYGDNHPVYAGSVVKAMASAKDGYLQIAALFAEEIARTDPAAREAREASWVRITAALNDGLRARVEAVVRLTPTIVEVIVHAPYQARRFQPGQFYRLQNLEVDSPLVGNTRLAMEGVALTGAWVDRAKGLLSLIVLELGVSSRLCATLKVGQQVVVMGPTGAPTEIPVGEKVLLAGGGLGNAVLFSIGKALRREYNKVVYFAGYKRREDLFKRGEIESACDQVVWSVDVGEPIEPGRPQDLTLRGNIVEAMVAYGEGRLGERLVPLSSIDRIIAIGSDRMMAAVKEARRGVLAPLLKPEHKAISSINSPMQCMMKEVCAQCLQKHVDANGAEQFVFSCFNQDQLTDHVDFPNLRDRLRQNTVVEKLSNKYLELLFEKAPELLRL
jgi:NADPH-dependent glutamate synthase beta subunit-like oxidoreductase/NAD(P)H-flavin reductase